jgi:hypothetical protein
VQGTEARLDPRAATGLARRPGEWNSMPIAQNRYDGDGLWTLYFSDRCGKRTRYLNLMDRRPALVFGGPPLPRRCSRPGCARRSERGRFAQIPPPDGTLSSPARTSPARQRADLKHRYSLLVEHQPQGRWGTLGATASSKFANGYFWLSRFPAGSDVADYGSGRSAARRRVCSARVFSSPRILAADPPEAESGEEQGDGDEERRLSPVLKIVKSHTNGSDSSRAPRPVGRAVTLTRRWRAMAELGALVELNVRGSISEPRSRFDARRSV